MFNSINCVTQNDTKYILLYGKAARASVNVV